jgi:hypothetical protein
MSPGVVIRGHTTVLLSGEAGPRCSKYLSGQGPIKSITKNSLIILAQGFE